MASLGHTELILTHTWPLLSDNSIVSSNPHPLDLQINHGFTCLGQNSLLKSTIHPFNLLFKVMTQIPWPFPKDHHRSEHKCSDPLSLIQPFSTFVIPKSWTLQPWHFSSTWRISVSVNWVIKGARRASHDVIMGTMATEITSLTVIYSTVYSSADQRKHQSSVSLAFVREFTGDRWIPRTNGQ